MIETYGRAKGMLACTSIMIGGLKVPNEIKSVVQNALADEKTRLDNLEEENVWGFLANTNLTQNLPRHEVVKNLRKCVRILTR